MQVGIVVADDPWRYFTEIYQELDANHEVSVFQKRNLSSPFFRMRINRFLFHHDLETFLSKQQVVFFEWASELLAMASHLPKQARIVTRLHRYEMFEWARKVNWANVDRIILVSRAMQKKFAERFPEHADRAVVVYEGVSTEKFQPVSKAFNEDIGTLCFLSPRKRVYELVLAFAEIVQERPGLRLHIGGSSNKFGDYVDAVYSLVKKLGLQDKVIFYGNVTEPWNWYRNIDVFISNSFSEGLQVAPMEAMASERFCISHHWDGAEDLLPAENLFLTNTELKRKILRYCDLPADEKRQQQERMRAIACEKFDIRQISAQIRAVIEEVTEKDLVKG